jgi:UDP-N-acetylmuramyl pentapeptide phosphotransferase/UDP-N-acetylglucosamine-1-phosphate transferase
MYVFTVDIIKNRNNLENVSWVKTGLIGFVVNFFDVLGIGAFAPQTALLKFTKQTSDKLIPGTMNVANTLPVLIQALIFIQVVEVEPLTLVVMFLTAMIGAILAFLKFNLKPAKIFMGDVGSLAIGASLGVLAIILKKEILFGIVGLLFVIEAVSVILQVCSYKLRQKRIFLMAPIHHHFEKLGWSETKVVRVFWLASIMFAGIGMLSFLVK